MLTNNEKFDRAPKWVQQEAKVLEMRLNEAQRLIKQMENNPKSPIWHSRDFGAGSEIYLPETNRIHVVLDEEQPYSSQMYMQLAHDSVDDHNYLYVSAMDRALVVEPAGGINCLRIFPKKLLTNK